jgi:hypothetical protein
VYFSRPPRWRRRRRRIRERRDTARHRVHPVIQDIPQVQDRVQVRVQDRVLEQIGRHKCASTIMQGDATSHSVSDCMSANSVGDQIHGINVTGVIRHLQPSQPQLHRQEWAHHMAQHPDRQFAEMILEYIDSGVPIFYEGPDYQRVCPNWGSTKVFKDDVLKTIAKDIKMERKSGPFTSLPMWNFVGSPMGAFAKKRSAKVRVIHDLSWPPDTSINSHIPAELCSVSYVSVDDAVKLVRQAGVGARMSKIDLTDAYKNIRVREKDWHLLGSSWTDDQGETVYYIDHVLPFGLRSSAVLFNHFADGLEYVMFQNGVSKLIHYLDDYFTCGAAASDECERNLMTMLHTCGAVGMPVNPAKTSSPSNCMEFLGVIIDSVKCELRMSDERMLDVIGELEFWENRRQGTKRQLLSVLGKLVFLSRVIVPGRIFLRRLFELSSKTMHLQHRVRLNVEASLDIKWWLTFAREWNGRSFFLDEAWSQDTFLELSTDASDYGYAGVFGKRWYAEQFTAGDLQRSIAYRELLAVVVACVTWAGELTSKRILIHCDNMAVVQCVNGGSSKCGHMMRLIRELFYVAAANSFVVRLVHVPGKLNIGADLLSRGRLKEFKAFRPECEVSVSPIVNITCERPWS